MNDAQRGVAILDLIHDHAHGDRVVDLFERALLRVHLAGDRPEVLRAPVHLRLDALLARASRSTGMHAGDVAVAVAAERIERRYRGYGTAPGRVP